MGNGYRKDAASRLCTDVSGLSTGRTVSDSTFKMPKHIAVVCGVCATRMTPPSKHAGRRVKCPDCETMCPIPTVEQLKKRHREEQLAAPTQPQDHDPYDLKAPDETLEPPPQGRFRTISEIKRREIPDPPKSLFFSSVFEFPFLSKGTLVRWSFISLGFSFVGFLGWLGVYMMQWGFVAAIAAGTSILGVAIIGLISAGYAASCGFAILQETAAGVNRIEEWPDEGWRDGIFEFFLVLWLHAVSGFFCYVIAVLAQPLTDSLFVVLLPLHAFAFPLVLIAAMDSDSAWLPWSSMAMRSLKRLPGIWFLFYLISVVVVCLLGGLWTLLAMNASFAAGLTFGPVVATMVFVYARLMGRLAWKIGDDASEEMDQELAEL